MHKKLLLLFLALLLACPAWAQNFAAPVFKIEPRETLPHNPEHFTQGLFFHQGVLYESTGLYGHSRLVRYAPAYGDGEIEAETILAETYFGEGAVAAGDQVYWLTWREHTGFRLEAGTLRELGRFTYSSEGWGLTFDGDKLIRSDGSDQLHFHDLNGRQLDSLAVRDGSRPVRGLNELEWVPAHNIVLANVWPTTAIAVINLRNGAVLAWLDGSGLEPDRARFPKADVLNGIALSPDGKSLWLTGKRWPDLYVVDWPLPGLETLLP